MFASVNVYTFLCVYTYVCRCPHTCVHSEARDQFQMSSPRPCLSPQFLPESELSHSVRLADPQSPEILLSQPPIGGTTTMHIMLGFLCERQDLNSGPQTCAASTLWIEPSPWSSVMGISIFEESTLFEMLYNRTCDTEQQQSAGG